VATWEALVAFLDDTLFPMTDDISGDIIKILEKNTGFSDHRRFKH
jgi:hypothetical protein